MYKLVIPTAGIGSRIGPYTKFKNKALVSVGLKPAIIKVMENFDDASEIIILTGYEAETLKDVILAFYPDKNIRFIHVDNYSGEGSGLGHTLNQAREYLQCPFIFSPNDAIFHSFDFDSFKENECCDMDSIELFDDETLRDDIGITNKIHRKKILKKCRQMKEEMDNFKDNLGIPTILYKPLAKYGVVTLSILCNEIKTKNDLKIKYKMTNENQCQLLWNIIQQNENMKTIK